MSVTKIERGDIFYINKSDATCGSEQKAGKPGIIVSNNKNNQNSETVEVIYLTTRPKPDLPTHVTIRSTSLVSTALCEQITSVSTKRLGEYIGMVSQSEMLELEEAMIASLGLCRGDTENADVTEHVYRSDKERMGDQRLIYESRKIAYLAAERDTYKKLYEGLLDRMMKG